MWGQILSTFWLYALCHHFKERTDKKHHNRLKSLWRVRDWMWEKHLPFVLCGSPLSWDSWRAVLPSPLAVRALWLPLIKGQWVKEMYMTSGATYFRVNTNSLWSLLKPLIDVTAYTMMQPPWPRSLSNYVAQVLFSPSTFHCSHWTQGMRMNLLFLTLNTLPYYLSSFHITRKLP